MPRKRRPDQGPPLPRIRNACVRCREKRFKCSESKPCSHCLAADVPCTIHRSLKRRCTEAEHAEADTQREDDVVELTRDDFLLADSFVTRSRLESVRLDDRSDHEAIVYDSTRGSAAGPKDGSESSVEDSSVLTTSAASMDAFLETPIFLSRPSTPVTSRLLELNPQYRELWYHYTEILSNLHTPHEVSSNPIVQVLSPVAQSHDPLLAVLLASSLENYRSLRGLAPDEALLTTLINTAVVGVQRELTTTVDGKVGDETLATVIALCDFEVVARKRATTSSWRVHLEGARRLISLRGGPKCVVGRDSDFYQFLIKWLAYFDIMAALTNTNPDASPLFEGKYWLKAHGEDAVLEQEDFKLDPYMGFLQNVVPFFIEIGHLTKAKRHLQRALNLREAHELHLRCRLLESSLKDTLGTATGQAWMSPKKLSIMIDCHDAFVYSTMIHLYRRVEGLGSGTPDVRTAVIQGLAHIARSCQQEDDDDDRETIDSSLLFPLFTFGCEAASAAERAFVLDRLTALGALGLGNVDRAVEVLLSIWASSEGDDAWHDSDRQLDWDQILHMFHGWEVNLA